MHLKNTNQHLLNQRDIGGYLKVKTIQKAGHKMSSFPKSLKWKV